MISRGNIFGITLMAATISAMFGMIIWLCLDPLLPFVFLLSPFFLLLSLPVGLPILYCWRGGGRKPALWAAAFSSLFLYVGLPNNFALMMMLQLIVPAAFMAAIADLRTESTPRSEGDFIPLSTILSTTALLITITTIILAVFLNNSPSLNQLLDNSINEMVRILTLMRTLTPQQISQFELLLRFNNYALIVGIFAFYSFVTALTNFYIASRLKKDLPSSRRPRDYWLYSASSLPQIQVVLLIGATIFSFLPIQEPTLQNCLDIISTILLLSFTLTGLASIHFMTRDKIWRPFLLTVLYGGIILFFSSLALAFLGVFVSTTPFLQRYKNKLKSHR